MEKFAVDLDKVLDDFELDEGEYIELEGKKRTKKVVLEKKI